MTATTNAPDDLDQMRAALQNNVDTARTILEGAAAEQRDLTEDEAARHDELVARGTGMRDMIRRTATYRDAMGRSGGLISAAGSPERGQYDSDSRVGAAPSLMLTRDQIGALHEGYLTRSVTSVTAPQAGVSDYLTLPVGTYPILRDAFRVLDLIPVEATLHPSITYYRGSVAASGAKVVGEGGQKPLSDPVWVPVTENVRKIAHYLQVSTEALDDLSSFRDMVESEALMGLLDAENGQILSGDGAAVGGTGGVAMTGLLNVSGILSYAPAGAEARILSIAKAQTQLQAGSSFTNPDSLIIHPNDMQLVRVYASSTGEFTSGFALGGDSQSTMVWGMKTYVTNRVTAGTALVGNLAKAARVYQREAPTVRIDPYSLSTQNLIKFIVEERLALTVPRPSALLKITFNGAL